jgi:hypothetical protein
VNHAGPGAQPQATLNKSSRVAPYAWQPDHAHWWCDRSVVHVQKGMTALAYACMHGYLEPARLLCEAGADMDMNDNVRTYSVPRALVSSHPPQPCAHQWQPSLSVMRHEDARCQMTGGPYAPYHCIT